MPATGPITAKATTTTGRPNGDKVPQHPNATVAIGKAVSHGANTDRATSPKPGPLPARQRHATTGTATTHADVSTAATASVPCIAATTLTGIQPSPGIEPSSLRSSRLRAYSAALGLSSHDRLIRNPLGKKKIVMPGTKAKHAFVQYRNSFGARWTSECFAATSAAATRRLRSKLLCEKRNTAPELAGSGDSFTLSDRGPWIPASIAPHTPA
jgi:hypothetical protein